MAHQCHLWVGRKHHLSGFTDATGPFTVEVMEVNAGLKFFCLGSQLQPQCLEHINQNGAVSEQTDISTTSEWLAGHSAGGTSCWEHLCAPDKLFLHDWATAFPLHKSLKASKLKDLWSLTKQVMPTEKREDKSIRTGARTSRPWCRDAQPMFQLTKAPGVTRGHCLSSYMVVAVVSLRSI